MVALIRMMFNEYKYLIILQAYLNGQGDVDIEVGVEDPNLSYAQHDDDSMDDDDDDQSPPPHHIICRLLVLPNVTQKIEIWRSWR
jgi:hypothetical protein